MSSIIAMHSVSHINGYSQVYGGKRQRDKVYLRNRPTNDLHIGAIRVDKFKIVVVNMLKKIESKKYRSD